MKRIDEFWILKGDMERWELLQKQKVKPILLPEFDPLIMGHQDKSRFLEDKYRTRVFLPLAEVAQVVLIQETVLGTWNYKISDRAFKINLFTKLKKDMAGKLQKEVERLTEFLQSR